MHFAKKYFIYLNINKNCSERGEKNNYLLYLEVLQ